MIRVDRHERGGVIKLANHKIDSNSALRVTGAATRNGVFTYRTGRELRPDNLVFRELEQWDGLPITVDHPAMLDADNIREHAVGYVVPGSARRDGAWLMVAMIITDPRAIEMILDSTLTELSGGYQVDVVDHAGFWNGEAHDQMQVIGTLKMNHLALCYPGTARAGSGAKVL